MKLKIIRIEDRVVTCELDDGTILDVGRRWFSQDLKVDDIIEFDVTDKSNKE